MGKDAHGIWMEEGQVRIAKVPHVLDTLVILKSKETDAKTRRGYCEWNCEDLRNGRERLISERFLGRVYTDMEAIAWASSQKC